MIPKRSKTSRSWNSALRQMGVSEGTMDALGAVFGAHAQNYRAFALLDGIQVVDDFEVPAGLGLHDLIHFLLHAVDELLDLGLGGDFFERPVDAGDVGAEVKARVRAIAQESWPR